MRFLPHDSFIKLQEAVALNQVRHKKVTEYYTMLTLSFSTNNIQNPLQRHYRRGQTILPFEQNLIEDTHEIKAKVFRENHQNNH